MVVYRIGLPNSSNPQLPPGHSGRGEPPRYRAYRRLSLSVRSNASGAEVSGLNLEQAESSGILNQPPEQEAHGSNESCRGAAPGVMKRKRGKVGRARQANSKASQRCTHLGELFRLVVLGRQYPVHLHNLLALIPN